MPGRWNKLDESTSFINPFPQKNISVPSEFKGLCFNQSVPVAININQYSKAATDMSHGKLHHCQNVKILTKAISLFWCRKQLTIIIFNAKILSTCGFDFSLHEMSIISGSYREINHDHRLLRACFVRPRSKLTWFLHEHQNGRVFAHFTELPGNEILSIIANSKFERLSKKHKSYNRIFRRHRRFVEKSTSAKLPRDGLNKI